VTTQRVAALLAGFLAAATALPAASQPAAPDAADSTRARAILTRMGEHLGAAQKFSVTIDAAYDVVQASGQKVEFGAVRRLLLSRPDKLRIDLEQRDGAKQLVLFDGSNLTMFTPKANVFASVAKPGTIDQTVHYLVDDLQTPLPLSAMLLTTLAQDLDRRVTDIALVDEETVGGRAVDHVAARAAEIDFQVWIARGDQPVPVRIVISYKQAAGQPQFSATLSEWNFNPTIDASAFVFSPPANATPVAFMVPAPGRATPSGKRR
jgi:hypothetical protein